MTFTTDYAGYVPTSIEYQGHTIRQGWYDSGPRTWNWGTVWYCHGTDAQQSRWCPLCCERNGWTWVSPNSQYITTPPTDSTSTEGGQP